MVNQAINREKHPMPTVEDLIHTLNSTTVFFKLDLQAGYHQLTLALESQYITTFATHKGLWRYTRLNFGTNSASEIFQKTIHPINSETFQACLTSVTTSLFWKGTSWAALDAVCQIVAEANLTLNKKKYEFNKSSLTFFEFAFSGKRIAPDPKKVVAIKIAPALTTTSGVRSFLGMATHCAKFIPNFSDVSEPLQELPKKDQQFHWTAWQEQSFNHIKELLTSAQVMAYFDPCKQSWSQMLPQLNYLLFWCRRLQTRMTSEYQSNTHSSLTTIFSDGKTGSNHCMGNWETTHLSLLEPFQDDHRSQICATRIQQPQVESSSRDRVL